MANIQKLAKQSLETFRAVAGDVSVFRDKLASLQKTMHRIRASDLGMDGGAERRAQESAGPATAAPAAPAPVGYVFVAENSLVSMGVFVVERGAELPLHDHRSMHGLMKVLFGTIRLRSYDLLSEEQTGKVAVPDLSPYSASEEWQQSVRRTLHPARPLGEVELTADSEPCLLSPHQANLHSVHSVGGPAAFLDILSPPYDPDTGKDCLYYKETHFTESNETVGNVRWLQRIPQPPTFWCNQETYKGPVVNLDSL